MSPNHDDRGLSGRPEAELLRSSSPEDAELFHWLLNFSVATLMTKGLSVAEARALAMLSFRNYSRFRESVQKPQVFLAKHLVERADDYLKHRGLVPDAEDGKPHLLDVIRRKETLDALPFKARRALVILFYEGGSFADVAEELDWSFSYVERLVNKIVSKLDEARRRQEPQE